MKIIFNRNNVLTFVFLNLLFISYYLLNYYMGIWAKISDPIYYVEQARIISETFPLFERLAKIPTIIILINAPHFLYILLLSFSNNIFKYPVFTLQYFLFISILIQLYLLINFYNIKNKNITLVSIFISSGLIFWGSMPLKESLLANLFLLIFRFLFMYKNNNLLKFIYIGLVLFLISITRFWYPTFLLVNIFITFAIPNFIIIMRTFKLNKIYLIFIPILSIIILNINDFLFRIRFNPLLIIKNIISPNPFSLIFNENILYIPSAILFKFILLFSILELFKNYKKIFFNYQLSFLMFNYLLSVIALSDSVARGERHKFLALLSISIFYFVSKSIRSKENQTKKIN